MDVRSPRLALAALFFLFVGVAPVARAQSTDGYHAIQVFPVVVDTVAFTQRFQFRTAYSWDPALISVTYYPADGTAHSAPVTCQTFLTAYFEARSFASLRDLCPALAPGSAFGTIIARNDSGTPFAASSRVNNAAGSGFAVEAFPASDFTIATTAVTGLRRLAAQGGAPAYQTNCFVGVLAELAPSGPPTLADVKVTLQDAGGQVIGTKDLVVKPGQLIRLLDVFAAAGAPTGNHDDAVAIFEIFDDSGAPLISFCTVQDNTRFSADFRIGKQEWARLLFTPGAHDYLSLRSSLTFSVFPTEECCTPLVIPAGASRHVHALHFRHPDMVSCALRSSPPSPLALTPAYGLEMRLRVHDANGWVVLAGGNGSTGFSNLYLGDKPRHGEGANTSYLIEVESNGQNEAADRPYALVCTSGSGHTPFLLVGKDLPLSF